MLQKSWRDILAETKTQVCSCLLTNYNFDDINESMDKLFYERYKQWKSDLHKHFELFDDLEVALEEGCPLELEDQPDKWAWFWGHFQEPAYVKKAKVNKINREKKTLLHHSGSRPFSYRMEARRHIISV